MPQRCSRRTLALFVALAASLPAGASLQVAANLTDLTLEQLSSIRVTSVSRAEEAWSDAAASIYVITADDIRRSGATTLPEALRLAPNLFVARFDASTYAISARGFNSNIANKLLVLIDGRTVYSPLFSGTFWDLHDVMLADVERIEVISGPGAAQWGTNAVNGVINVITRPASQTQGALVALGSGERETVAAVRYGGSFGDQGHYRAYAKGWDTHDITRLTSNGAVDGFGRAQTGFRADWRSGRDAFTLQGDLAAGASANRARPGASQGVDVSGGNLLGRWVRATQSGGEAQLQVYLDQTEHSDNLLLDEKATLFDIEFRYAFSLGMRHSLQWGASYRHARDESEPGALFRFVPASRELDWTAFFLQDQIRLRDNLELTLGTRAEENTYTGWELLPSARLGWKADPGTLFWGALSRAVRAPSRLDREIHVPLGATFLLAGGPTFESEVANVAEVGWRSLVTRDLSMSLSLYRQEYKKLKTAELTNGGLPLTQQNRAEGSVTGVEAWTTWQVTPNWRLFAGVNTLESRLRTEPGSTDTAATRNLGNHPDYQWMLRSSSDLGERQQLDLAVRYVAALPLNTPNTAVAVPAYTAVDLRYAWTPRRDLELGVVLRNALDAAHREWGDTTTSAEIARSLLLTAVWRR